MRSEVAFAANVPLARVHGHTADMKGISVIQSVNSADI